MKFRVLPCLALNEMRALFMVQARAGGGRWMNVREGANACLFRTRLEADLFIDFERHASAVLPASGTKEGQ